MEMKTATEMHEISLQAVENIEKEYKEQALLLVYQQIEKAAQKGLAQVRCELNNQDDFNYVSHTLLNLGYIISYDNWFIKFYNSLYDIYGFTIKW